MISKFLSRNGEAYRVLLENEDSCWVISFDDPTRCPFCVSVAEMGNFQRVPIPQNFTLESNHPTPAEQKRLALIQPLLDQGEDAITGRQLRLSCRRTKETHLVPRLSSRCWSRTTSRFSSLT